MGICNIFQIHTMVYTANILAIIQYNGCQKEEHSKEINLANLEQPVQWSIIQEKYFAIKCNFKRSVKECIVERGHTVLFLNQNIQAQYLSTALCSNMLINENWGVCPSRKKVSHTPLWEKVGVGGSKRQVVAENCP